MAGLKTYNRFLSRLHTDAAGYNSNQCCPGVPEDIPCQAISAPVECGSIPCLYVSQCEASAAGFGESDCCPQVQGACTQEIDTVACGSNKCLYSGLSCAAAAGFSSDQCCKQPSDTGSCTAEYDPYICSNVGCEYSNACVAGKFTQYESRQAVSSLFIPFAYSQYTP